MTKSPLENWLANDPCARCPATSRCHLSIACGAFLTWMEEKLYEVGTLSNPCEKCRMNDGKGGNEPICMIVCGRPFPRVLKPVLRQKTFSF